MSRISQSIYFCVASALLLFGLASTVSSAERASAEKSGNTPSHLPVHSSEARICEPRIARASGVQRGNASQVLLKAGNVACVEAQYGGQLRVEIMLCDGDEVDLRGIGIERNGFANGRRMASSPAILYELIYKNGSESLPQPLGRGYSGRRGVSFPAQTVTGVMITVPSEANYNQVNEQLCSIVFDVE